MGITWSVMYLPARGYFALFVFLFNTSNSPIQVITSPQEDMLESSRPAAICCVSVERGELCAATAKAQVLDVGELSSQHHPKMGPGAARQRWGSRVNSEQWVSRMWRWTGGVPILTAPL